MAIVTERLNASRPQTPTQDPRNAAPRSASSVVNNNRDLGVDPPKDEGRFFGSFFQSKKAVAPKRSSVVGGLADSGRPVCVVIEVKLLSYMF